MSWTYVRADQYCESVRDGTHDTPKPAETGYKLVTGKHIKAGQIDPSGAYCISEKDYDDINARSRVAQWDVLMSMIGTVGGSAVVKEPPCYAIKNVALFKCGGSELKGRWLSYYLRSPLGQGHMSGNQKGSSQQFLSLKQLRSLPVPVPEKRFMQKAVQILSAYDNLIENSQKQIRLLEEAARRLYKEWFLELRFPGYVTTPVVDGLPEGWAVNRADVYFDISIGKTPPRAEKKWFSDENGGIPWVSISDMGSLGVYTFCTAESLTAEAISKYNVKTVPADTILLSFKLTVGRVSITTKDTCTNEAIAHFVTPDRFLREYAYLYLKCFQYDSLGNTSAISRAVNSRIVKAMPFVMPDTATLRRFHQSAKPILDAIKAKQRSIIYLEEARDRLLPKLISGEIEV